MKGNCNLLGKARRLRVEPVLLHFAPKRHGADLQRVGGLTPIAVKTLERARDHGPFLCLKIEAVVGRTRARLLRDLVRQFAHLDAAPASNDHGALDGVLELSNVARPTVVHQGCHRIGRNRIDVHVAFRANPPDFALLKRSQQLRQGRSKLADLLQEQRAVPLPLRTDPPCLARHR
jgi:hypothetical protein